MKRTHRLQSMASFVLALALLGATPVANFAADKYEVNTARGVVTISIENFGKVNDNFYRGAQPKDEQYEELAALGVKTVVDLRDDAKRDSRRDAEAAGLRYLNLPLDDKGYPAADADDRFLEIVNDHDNWPVYVHCAGGRHRTGAMTAVYRMTMEGWDIERAYREMKDYDFYTAWGHGVIKDYVYDYYRELPANYKAKKVVTMASTTAEPSVVEESKEAKKARKKARKLRARD